MSDIHGCYDEFIRMLDNVSFSDTDQLILAGDCIDRGKQSYEMLAWMERRPKNVRFVRGNHEEEFAAYVNLMRQVDFTEKLDTGLESNKDAVILYETVRYFIKRKGLSASCFDLYGTVGSLLKNHGVTFARLCGWADFIWQMPYYCELKHLRADASDDRIWIVVHAGYTDKTTDISGRFDCPEQFYLYAREESCRFGGRRHAVIAAGHTPTIVKGEFAYNEGKVFRYYDKTQDCIFYDIDCGCAFRDKEPDAKLACIRMEDEKIFYV